MIDGLDLSMDSGEVVGLSGPSGCGKTTLALALLGLLPPDVSVSGSIRFRGQELCGLSEQALAPLRGAAIGLVFQESALALNPLLTAGAQIAEVVRAHTADRPAAALERARAMLAEVGFGQESARVFAAYPHELSGGQRQRILIAQALAARPALIIADEPVASLDEDASAQVLELIRTLRQRWQVSFLLITHSAEVMASVADRVIEMSRGGGADHCGHVAGVQSLALATPEPHAGRHAMMVEVRGLSRTYRRRRLLGRPAPGVRALDQVNLRIRRGTTLGLAGRSGCGKSTLARCIAGLERPDAGNIYIDGTDIVPLGDRDLRPFRNRVQMIFQDSAAAMNPRFPALEIVSEPAVIQRRGTAAERLERAAALLTRVGLSPDRLKSRPHEFSAGERQRLAVARALAVGPRLLILDESLSGLDAATRGQIVRLLRDLQAAHDLTYLCISHDAGLLAEFGANVAVMQDGRITHAGHSAALAAEIVA